MMLHENKRLVIVHAESFHTIHITQRNFGLTVRKNDKIVLKYDKIARKLLIISLNK